MKRAYAALAALVLLCAALVACTAVKCAVPSEKKATNDKSGAPTEKIFENTEESSITITLPPQATSRAFDESRTAKHKNKRRRATTRQNNADNDTPFAPESNTQAERDTTTDSSEQTTAPPPPETDSEGWIERWY